jgi:hypothetical protein
MKSKARGHHRKLHMPKVANFGIQLGKHAVTLNPLFDAIT